MICGLLFLFSVPLAWKNIGPDDHLGLNLQFVAFCSKFLAIRLQWTIIINVFFLYNVDLHGFDFKVLLIANCKFFHNSQLKESQIKENAMSIDITMPLLFVKHSIEHSCIFARFSHVQPSRWDQDGPSWVDTSSQQLAHHQHKRPTILPRHLIDHMDMVFRLQPHRKPHL